MLLDANGSLRFIDPIIGFKGPLLTMFADTSKLEGEIDSIVYKLYGLTDDEIKVVEQAVKK